MRLDFLKRVGRPSPPTLTPVQASSTVIAIRETRTPAIPGRNSLDWSLTLVQLADDVANILQSTPAAAAAALLTVVLRTIADVKVNQERCMRIGKRAARSLTQLGEQMEGKWDSAPPSLIKNLHALESTLSELQDSMRHISQANWRKRVLSRPQIEDMLQQCETQLDEALQAFQFTALIQIHYAVEPRHDQFTLDRTGALVTTAGNTSDVVFPEAGVDEIKGFLTAPVDDFGFRRYHASEVILKKRRAQSFGWFSDLSEANSNGTQVVVKSYVGSKDEAVKQWYRDVRLLRNLYHPCLPQLLGYSNGKASTPFILLSDAPKQDVVSYTLASWAPQTTATDILRAWLGVHKDISAGMLYVKQQLSLDDDQLNQFIQTSAYGIGHDQRLVIGLPVQEKTSVERRRWAPLPMGHAILGRNLYDYMRPIWQGMNPTAPEPILGANSVACGLSVFKRRPELNRLDIQAGTVGLTQHSYTDTQPYDFDAFAIGDIVVGDVTAKGGFCKAGNIWELDSTLSETPRLKVEQRDHFQSALLRMVYTGEPGEDYLTAMLYPSLDPPAQSQCGSVRFSSIDVECAWMHLFKWAHPLAQTLGVHPSQLRMITELGGPRPNTGEPAGCQCYKWEKCDTRDSHAVRLFQISVLQIDILDNDLD
ncbi:hypothetical protein FA95DRAFT_1553471 [Auriscalpium vulgare]|uniref:Uncharacterized protein n=1 Tax=Auriscalpium vulgare TaxID=40419 RepID=A0ACB8S933_9AGAM|nr:hypothetical protein FA95DRAFT_1553471 [Auriscalpium vulgare]